MLHQALSAASRNRRFLQGSALVATGISCLIAAPVSLQAATYYWDNDGTTAGFGTASGTWAAPTTGDVTQGWSTDSGGIVVPGSVTTTTSDSLYFGTDTLGLGSGTINVSGTVDAKELLFGKVSGAVTLSGGSIKFADSGTSNIRASSAGGSASSTHTINSNIQKVGGTLTVGRQNTSGENYIFNGVLSGGFSFDNRVQNNTSYVALNGLNTFTGNVSIVTGQLNVNTVANAGVASALGAGTAISMAGGGGQSPTLWYTGNSNGSTNRAVNLNGGASTRIVSQDAELTLAGDVEGIAGSYETNLLLSGDAGGGSNFNQISGDVSGNLKLSVTSVAPISGSAETGRWILSGTNTYTGTTTINSGNTLQIGAGGTTGTFGTGAVTNDGSLIFNRSNDYDVDNAISGTGTLTQKGSGRLILDVDKTSYSGNTIVDNGTLVISENDGTVGGWGVGSSVEINNGATLAFRDEGSDNRFVVSNKTLTFDNSGGGVIDFEAGNILMRDNTIETTGGDKNTVRSTGGSFNLQSLSVTFSVADGTDASGVDLEVSAGISGTSDSSVTKNGTGTLSMTGNSFYSGTTNVDAGTLLVNGNNSSATGAVTVASGATLGGSGTIGGATTIQSGGTLAAGNSPGVLTFNDDLTLDAGSETIMEITGTTRGTEYDGIDVGGLLTYGGDLIITSDSLIVDGVYDLFGINGTEGGDFASVVLSGLAYSDDAFALDSDVWTATVSGKTYTFSQLTGDLTVVPEPGTYALLSGLLALGYVMLRRR